MERTETKTTEEADAAFLSEIRHNTFLEREEAYHKMNIELERKTSELIARMERYSKSRSCAGSTYDGGGGDTASEFGYDDGISICSERIFSSRSSFVNEEFCDDGNNDHREKLYSQSQVSWKGSQGQVSNDNAEEPTNNVLNDDFIHNPAIRRQKHRLQKATESVIKNLQSKLLNHEERLTDLQLQYRQKIQENIMQDSKIKALEEERERLLRTISNQQNTVEKHAKHAESSKSNLSIKSQTVTTLKREIDDLKREKRQSSSSCTSYQSRLHRLTEENEKLKNLNKSFSLQLREIQADNKLKLDEKQQKIIELEKQRNSLNSTITKQAQVIKLLREQKVIKNNNNYNNCGNSGGSSGSSGSNANSNNINDNNSNRIDDEISNVIK